MSGLVVLTMAMMWGLPKISKQIPAGLTAILVVAGITIFGGVDVSTVGSFIRESGGEGLAGGLPSFQWQIFDLLHTLDGHWGELLSTAVLLAAVGKQVTFHHLSPECQMLLTKASPDFENHIVPAIDDPRYHVVTDLMDAEI